MSRTETVGHLEPRVVINPVKAVSHEVTPHVPGKSDVTKKISTVGAQMIPERRYKYQRVTLKERANHGEQTDLRVLLEGARSGRRIDHTCHTWNGRGEASKETGCLERN